MYILKIKVHGKQNAFFKIVVHKKHRVYVKKNNYQRKYRIKE